VGNNTDSVLRRFPVLNVRFFVTFRFFLRLPGFNASLFLSFTSSSVLSIIFLYLYGLAPNALVAAVEVAAGWAEGVYTVYGVEVAAGWAGMIVPRGYRRFGDGWVRFNRISNIHTSASPPHVLSNNHTEDLYAIG
jgi:hypothetical protein